MPTDSIYRSPESERQIKDLYDKAVSRWPVPNEHITVPTRFGDTFIVASGAPSAPPLVLLHGANSCVLAWMGEIAEYSRHFRTYAVDIIGEPGRSAPARPSLNGPAYAEWLANVLDALKVPKTSLAGLSQGGWTALKFAVTYPERVDKLVLLSPAGVTPDRTSFLLRVLLLYLAGKPGRQSINRYVFGKDKIDATAREMMNVIMTGIVPHIERLNLFVDDELRRLTMPVLLLGGDKDRIRDVSKIGTVLRQFAPQLSVKILPGRGHVLVNTAELAVEFLNSED